MSQGDVFLGHTGDLFFQHLIQIGVFSSLSHPNDHLDSQFSLLNTCSSLSCVTQTERTVSGQRQCSNTGIYENIVTSTMETILLTILHPHLWGLLTARPEDMVCKHPDLPKRDTQAWLTMSWNNSEQLVNQIRFYLLD